MRFLNRILLNSTAACLILAVFHLHPVSTVAQGRILPGPGPETIPSQQTFIDHYNNDLRPPEVPVSKNTEETPDTVTIINQILQDRFLRSPIAVIVDTAPPFLHRAKKLLQTVVSTKTSLNMILIPFNGTGFGPVQNPMGMTQLQNAVQNLRPVAEDRAKSGGAAFYSMLKATEKVPFDSAVLLFTGRAAQDEDLAQITTQNLLSKRCRLYVLWLDPSASQNNGIEALYNEVAQRTGGGLIYTKASDFPQDENDPENTRPFTNMQQVSEVTLAMKLGLMGQARQPFQVDKTVTSLIVTMQGPVKSAHLTDPFGNSIDLTQDAEMKQSLLRYAVLARDDNILCVQLNTSVAAPGIWMLTTAGADAKSRYNVIVRGTSSLYFNASTAVVPSAHGEGSTNQNIQFQLDVPQNIAAIKNVSLVNKDGTKLSQLQYNQGDGLLPAVNIPAHKLSTEPFYLQLIANTNDGEVIERFVEVKHQTASYAFDFTVDVLPQSTIEIQPGETVNLVFNVTNHHPELARLTFTCQAKDYQYITPQFFIYPPIADVPPGRSKEIQVTGPINRNVPKGTTVTIEFSTRPYWGAYTVVSRAVYLYVGVPPISDSDRPTINYSVNNNCKNVPQESCSTSVWNMEANVQDSRSGLISVTSNPTGIKFQPSYIAGTKVAVPLTYSASCCAPIIDIKATDAKGNYITQHIDANADNEGISDAEIAAVVLGVLLLIIIIIAIVLAICLCKRRKSHNLQHTLH